MKYGSSIIEQTILSHLFTEEGDKRITFKNKKNYNFTFKMHLS